MLIRPAHQVMETWHWLAIIGLAMALCLALATAVGAADTSEIVRPPKQLPERIDEWAIPMPDQNSTTSADAQDVGRELWRILTLHRNQEYELAIAEWNRLTVPGEARLWKWLALSQAATTTFQFEQAEQYLLHAMELRPDYALAYYHQLGKEYLARGQNADAWRAFLKANHPGYEKLNTLIDSLRFFRSSVK